MSESILSANYTPEYLEITTSEPHLFGRLENAGQKSNVVPALQIHAKYLIISTRPGKGFSLVEKRPETEIYQAAQCFQSTFLEKGFKAKLTVIRIFFKSPPVSAVSIQTTAAVNLDTG